jgi:hypothetical protein
VANFFIFYFSSIFVFPASFGQQQEIHPTKSSTNFTNQPLNLYQINPRTNRQTNQPSKKQPRKFFMAIFGVTD